MTSLLKRIPRSLYHRVVVRFFGSNRVRSMPRHRQSHNNQRNVLQCCIAYNEHGGFCIPLSSHHRPAAQKVLSGGIHEPDTIAFLTTHGRDGDIVHAGTYFGDFLPALSNSRMDGAKVWAFEPNPESFRCASITAKINNLDNVTLTNAGLGERQDSAKMMTSDGDKALGGASRILSAEENISTANQETVQIVSVDEVVPADRKVSIIQLDVEFFEQQALSGAIETIKRCRPVIILENLPDQQWLEENVLALGYRIGGKLHANTIINPVDE